MAHQSQPARESFTLIMGKTSKLVAVALILIAACVVGAQDVKIISHVPNRSRIARAWNSIAPATKEWNEAMSKADYLLHERFNPKLVVVDPELKRKESVAAYKAAREALLKELDALNELIEEEDY
jgi:hypothetical protein